MTRSVLFLLLLLAALTRAADPLTETSVGLSVKLEGVVLPGPELQAKKADDRNIPVVVRVVKTYPHGTDFRYDLEFYALTPGIHDLRDYLLRADGKPLEPAVKSLPVKVVPLLPPGQVEPNKLEIDKVPPLGGYRTWVIVLVVAWTIGLFVIVAWMIVGRTRNQLPVGVEKPISLADKLRPLVEGAVAGNLSTTELANLERGLFAYWRKQLNLESVSPETAIRQLRAHPDAGPLLSRLEDWLHKPGPATMVNIGELLRPYQNLPPDDAELGVTA